MIIYTKEQIEAVIAPLNLMEEIEKGLMWYSEGKVNTSPLGFLQFTSPPGDVHIKSCARVEETSYVVKIASGFYENPKLGLSSSNGLMLLFSQQSGTLQAILLEEGRLTDLRTALVGAICARHFAPKQLDCIGIIGTGTQAKQQLLNLQFATSCRKALVWGRNHQNALTFARDSDLASFSIQAVDQIEELTQCCHLIVTTTASSKPLLFGHQLLPGTHVTAVGADSFEKQELDSSVFDLSDLIIVDSLAQCLEYGDLSHARHSLETYPIIELGEFLKTPFERKENWITVADLTGVAIEDLQIAKAIVASLQKVISSG